MGSENWSLTAKSCDSCKAASATVFCRADTAFLCLTCDSKIHAANKLASRHARVWVCEVCEQAPASVTCKADAAALCVTCDRDIHSANPLARRHERFPVVPFYDSAAKCYGAGDDSDHNDDDNVISPNCQREDEAEAASWLLQTPKEVTDDEHKSSGCGFGYFLYNDIDSFLDIDIMSLDQKPQILPHQQHQQENYSSDGVVPYLPGQVVDGFPSYEINFTGSKPYSYNFSSQSISQSVSSSSLDVGVVPDHSTMTDVSNNLMINSSAAGGADAVPNPVSGVDREARVMRYREKRKNRKFEKTIRYASRKAYAETRPRIKGRFAKRTEIEIDSFIAADASYGVVPSF